MKPRGPLMTEHRTIERVLNLVRNEICSMTERKRVDSVFLDHVVDFIHTYADRTHHGKEEDILFRELAKKSMSEQDKRIMQELVDEHKYARTVVGELVCAKQKYMDGESSAIDVIAARLPVMVDFYPVHIEKEDKVFFRQLNDAFPIRSLLRCLPNSGSLIGK